MVLAVDIDPVLVLSNFKPGILSSTVRFQDARD